tara:strand:- start:10629 stop:11177 length:549 start_codon:yes stop_codon:yes gene_type:complete
MLISNAAKWLTFLALAALAFTGGYRHAKASGANVQAETVSAPQTALKTAPAGYTFTAVATVYNMEASQCDSTPGICADGTRASYSKRIVAVSRDQLERWGGAVSYGDKLRVTGAGKHDGIWNVHDTMNKRYGATAPAFDAGVAGVVKPHALEPVDVDGVAHIDFLTTDRLGKWHGVKCEVVR